MKLRQSRADGVVLGTEKMITTTLYPSFGVIQESKYFTFRESYGSPFL